MKYKVVTVVQEKCVGHLSRKGNAKNDDVI